jgi:arsenite-transporting ATPase
MKDEGRRPKRKRKANVPFHPSAFVLHPSARYLFFGGKGGVGKTTIASAAALYLLDRARAKQRILLFSTDPAHSLSDSLGTEIGDRTVEVARRAGARLEAREMNASAALELFKAKHRAVLIEIADRGTLLDESDIKEFLDLSLPGMDEVMALFELSELDREGAYTRIVVDTAPSGHTSRLLRLPEVFAGWLSALDRLEDKHRYIVAQFVRGRSRREDEVELFLRELSERIARVREMLYSPDRTAFTLVTIPEAMSVEETSRYFDLLKKEGVPVTALIVNRVEQEHDDCKYCRARASNQKPWLKRIAREFNALRIHEMPLLAEEARGLDRLRRFAQIAWEEKQDAETPTNRLSRPSLKSSKTVKTVPARGELKPAGFISASPASGIIESRRLLIFGGKGGVGKTTAAAAAALALAETNSSARVLIFSTDPAHSLSDSFDERVGELKRGVAGQSNLDAMEINPAAWFESLKQRYREWTDELFESLTAQSRWEIQFDREAMREIVQLAPPGIDEISALSAISNLLDEGRYTSIVLDTAPTGHLLRFLELPQLALSWVRTFIKLLLKYKDVVRWNGIAEELIALSKSIKRVAALLTSTEDCEFVGVAIAEQMSMEETARLTESLGRLKVPMRRLLINSVVPVEAASRCDFCGARRRGQENVIEEFKQRFGDELALFIAPQQPHEIRGAGRLREHFSNWKLLA